MQAHSKKYLIDVSNDDQEVNSIDRMQTIKDILSLIGEDSQREGLIDTPRRVVESWAELYEGYRIDAGKILETSFTNKENYNQLILLRDIEMFSMCEHHMLPFYGRVHIGYVPGGKVVGLSKLARLVECFSRRLQIQERLTVQIAEAIQEHMAPKGVGVMIECQHLCMVARGVNKQNSTMVTSHYIGSLETDANIKKEFTEQIFSKNR
ncbi:GTP cyclohydrolase I FolE [Legionella sp. CNM-4043-24]|uniref:GTP cyclohydrolase I FolE n=1 Tax=Legionella sp. CNM-4043-24 TaxID=3421646 RepID=UPI00403B0DA4